MSFHFSFCLDPDRHWYSYLSSSYQAGSWPVNPTCLRGLSPPWGGRAAVSTQKTTTFKGSRLASGCRVRFQRKGRCRHRVGACPLQEGPGLVVDTPSGLGAGRAVTQRPRASGPWQLACPARPGQSGQWLPLGPPPSQGPEPVGEGWWRCHSQQTPLLAGSDHAGWERSLCAEWGTLRVIR